MRRTIWLIVVLTTFPVLSARAQSGANATLQLPTYSTFGANTTVLVPDRGVSAVARERQSFYERTMYGGQPQIRAFGLAREDRSLHVTARVHDLQAAEAEVLSDVRARRANWTRGSLGALDPRTGSVLRPDLKSVAEYERERAAYVSARQRESEELLSQARRTRAAGKHGAAAVYYDMAARRADDAVRQKIEAEASELRQSMPARTAGVAARKP
jgi:hypothetical protein